MTEHYPCCKTVRFEAETMKRIEIAAAMFDITTSEYLRTLVRNTVAKINLDQTLYQEAS